MKRYIFIGIAFFSILMMSACTKDINTYKTVDPGKTATYPLNGEFWVRLDAATIAGTDTTWTIDPYSLGYGKILLMNTAANVGDSIWLDDQKNLWQVKVRLHCDPVAKTFGITNGKELYNNDTTNVSSGRLILGKGITKSGNVTDSITMVLHWVSDPTTVYRFSGVRRTGFQADDY